MYGSYFHNTLYGTVTIHGLLLQRIMQSQKITKGFTNLRKL